MTDDAQRPSLERAVELLVYAPLGAALFARDVLPPLVEQFVARGRTELEQRVTQARVIGRFAVTQGGQEIERRLQQVRDRGEAAVRTAPAPRTAAHAPAPAPSGNGSRADASGLPIPDYDELSASQVVARLAGLSPDELQSVRDYEESGRQRKTILTRIDQLVD